MRKLLVLAFVPLFFLLLAVPTAKADEVERGTMFATVYGGLYTGGGDVEFGIGGSIEYAFTERYGFLAEFNVVPGAEPSTWYTLGGSFVYNIPADMDKIIPYATAGFHYVRVMDYDTWAMSFGGGAKYQWKESMGLRFDVTIFAPEFEDVVFRLAGGAMWTF
jgi:hypothetical protein